MTEYGAILEAAKRGDKQATASLVEQKADDIGLLVEGKDLVEEIVSNIKATRPGQSSRFSDLENLASDAVTLLRAYEQSGMDGIRQGI